MPVATYDCVWCGKPQREDQPYLAWDWFICQACMTEMEVEAEECRRKNRELDEGV